MTEEECSDRPVVVGCRCVRYTRWCRVLVAYIDKIVRVWDLSPHKFDSTMSLKAILKRRAAVLNVREVAKVEKGEPSIVHFFHMGRWTGGEPPGADQTGF